MKWGSQRRNRAQEKGRNKGKPVGGFLGLILPGPETEAGLSAGEGPRYRDVAAMRTQTEYRECGLRGTRRAPSSEEKTEKCKQPSRGSGKSPGVLSELRGRCCERELTGHTQPDTSTAQRRSRHLVGESVFPSYCLPERVPHLCVLLCGQAQT